MTDAEIEALRQRQADARATERKRTEGKSPWDVAEDYVQEALAEFRIALDSPVLKTRLFAADRIAVVWAKMPPRPTAPPAKGMSAEDYQAALEAAEQDAAVQAYLVKKGWTPPVPSKERN